jgi:hypothetical protein
MIALTVGGKGSGFCPKSFPCNDLHRVRRYQRTPHWVAHGVSHPVVFAAGIAGHRSSQDPATGPAKNAKYVGASVAPTFGRCSLGPERAAPHRMPATGYGAAGRCRRSAISHSPDAHAPPGVFSPPLPCTAARPHGAGGECVALCRLRSSCRWCRPVGVPAEYGEGPSNHGTCRRAKPTVFAPCVRPQIAPRFFRVGGRSGSLADPTSETTRCRPHAWPN